MKNIHTAVFTLDCMISAPKQATLEIEKIIMYCSDTSLNPEVWIVYDEVDANYGVVYINNIAFTKFNANRYEFPHQYNYLELWDYPKTDKLLLNGDDVLYLQVGSVPINGTVKFFVRGTVSYYALPKAEHTNLGTHQSINNPYQDHLMGVVE